MKLELILSFVMTVLMSVKSEVENNIFIDIDNLFGSTTMQPIDPTTTAGGIIHDIITKGWWANLIDSISLCGFIAICAGIFCLCLCCCVGGCCWYKKRRSGASSFYEYYQGINRYYIIICTIFIINRKIAISFIFKCFVYNEYTETIEV